MDMSPFTVIMVAFAMIGALDRIFGNKLGLGKEFERGFNILGPTVLAMVGMIVLAPWLADVLQPVFAFLRDTLHLDPSIVPASLFANDMGGSSLSMAIGSDEQIGLFNALVVSSMMGCTVSFTIPYALEVVEKRQHRELLMGLLCGVVTIPVGCFFAGLVQGLPLGALLKNLLPLILFAILIGVGLLRCPNLCLKVFGAFGVLIKVLITIGLALAILKFTLNIELLPGLDTLENGISICVNACVMLAGTFPLMAVLSRLLRRPMQALGRKLHISEISATGLLGSLATSRTTFESMRDMDRKGVMLNAAFSVSAAFVFGGHLAFTMAIDGSLIEEVIIGKLIAGVLSLAVANFMFNRVRGSEER